MFCNNWSHSDGGSGLITGVRNFVGETDDMAENMGKTFFKKEVKRE